MVARALPGFGVTSRAAPAPWSRATATSLAALARSLGDGASLPDSPALRVYPARPVATFADLAARRSASDAIA